MASIRLGEGMHLPILVVAGVRHSHAATLTNSYSM